MACWCGAFEISVHGLGELAPAFGAVDAIQQDAVECGHTSGVFFFGKDPTFALDGQIPFGMNSRNKTAWMPFHQLVCVRSKPLVMAGYIIQT